MVNFWLLLKPSKASNTTWKGATIKFSYLSTTKIFVVLWIQKVVVLVKSYRLKNFPDMNFKQIIDKAK